MSLGKPHKKHMVSEIERTISRPNVVEHSGNTMDAFGLLLNHLNQDWIKWKLSRSRQRRSFEGY